jgi:hypothetical protein
MIFLRLIFAAAFAAAFSLRFHSVIILLFIFDCHYADIVSPPPLFDAAAIFTPLIDFSLFRRVSPLLRRFHMPLIIFRPPTLPPLILFRLLLPHVAPTPRLPCAAAADGFCWRRQHMLMPTSRLPDAMPRDAHATR